MDKPTKETVLAIDLSEQYKRINSRGIDFFNAEPGIEHYKLLAWISTQYSGKHLTEIGTLDGCGCLAMTFNSENTITTYDIGFYDNFCSAPGNLQRKLVTDESYWVDVMRSPIIFYDASHDGTQEREFLDELVKRGWKGLIVWDDIHLSDPMEKFWQSVTQRKADWTDIGHAVGTGLTWLE